MQTQACPASCREAWIPTGSSQEEGKAYTWHTPCRVEGRERAGKHNEERARERERDRPEEETRDRVQECCILSSQSLVLLPLQKAAATSGLVALIARAIHFPTRSFPFRLGLSHGVRPTDALPARSGHGLRREEVIDLRSVVPFLASQTLGAEEAWDLGC